MQQPPRTASFANPPLDAVDGAGLERQLDALITQTTVENLARAGGPIKTVKERDLRELIRQSLLQVLHDTPTLGTHDHEQILDRVQGELRRSMDSRPDPWAKGVDDRWFAGRQRREAERQGLEVGEILAQALVAHLAACVELLADYPATPPGIDPGSDVLARIRTVIALRATDQGWIRELQARQGALMSERDEARLALEEELQRVVQAEHRAEETERRVRSLTAQIDDFPLNIEPPSDVMEAELSDLRDQVSEAQSRLDNAISARTRVERELANAATGRATAERRLVGFEERLAVAEQRERELEALLGDQRRTTDLARFASVEAEALRSEVESVRLLLREREQQLTDERARHQGERERQRADIAARLDAVRRVEQALVGLREQLAERDRLLLERTAEIEALRGRPPTTVEAGEFARMAVQCAVAREALAAAEVAREEAHRSRLLAEAENAALRAHQADGVALQRERDWLRLALLARLPSVPSAAVPSDLASDLSLLSRNP